MVVDNRVIDDIMKGYFENRRSHSVPTRLAFHFYQFDEREFDMLIEYNRTFITGDQPCDCTAPMKPYRFGGTTFLDDHDSRGLFRHDSYALIEGNRVTVWLRACDVTELMSDAEYYASHSDYDFGIRSAARAICKRLIAAGEKKVHDFPENRRSF